MNGEQPVPIGVRTLFGQKSRRPLVALAVGEHETLMSPDKAREIAAMLFQAAEAAQADGFIALWLMNRVGAEEQHVVALLREFREFREAQRAEQSSEDDGP
jgi:hypothetical protein